MPSFHLALAEGVSVSDHDGEVLIKSPRAHVALRRLSSGVRAALASLAGRGEDEVYLQDRLLQDEDPDSLATFFYYLQRLDRLAMVVRSVSAAGQLLMTLVPTSPSFRFECRQIDAHRRYVLCRFGHVRRDGRRLVLESPLAHARIVLHGPAATAAVHALAEPGTPTELSTRAVDFDLLTLLVSAEMVHDDADEPCLPDWDFHDLLFHGSSRIGRHDHPVGAVYPFAGELPPPPAVERIKARTWHELARPDLMRLRTGDPPLTTALARERGDRPSGGRTLHAGQLGEFLYRAGRVRHQREVHVQTPRREVLMQFAPRPYPSGGSLYELELYAAVNRCGGLGTGLYYYDPVGHRLGLIGNRTPAFNRMLTDAAHCAAMAATQVQVLLVVSARFQRRAWKYGSTAYSNMLKDVGVLYETMCLIANVMGLASWPVPDRDDDPFVVVTGTDPFAQTSVGGCLLAGAGP